MYSVSFPFQLQAGIVKGETLYCKIQLTRDKIVDVTNQNY